MALGNSRRRGIPCWALGVALALVLGSSGEARALVFGPMTYFNGTGANPPTRPSDGLGFDNSSLMLAPDFPLPFDQIFEEPSNASVGVALLQQTITSNSVDQTLLLDLNMVDPRGSDHALVFVSNLSGDSVFDYGDANVTIESTDGFVVVTWDADPGTFYLGWLVELDTGNPADLERVFRYTIDQNDGGPPDFEFAVVLFPEPGTAVLLGLGLLLFAARRGPGVA